jgi:tetratricopeptide (TPR) repeat protein
LSHLPEDLYRRAIEAGDREALGHAARLLESADRVDEAVDLYRPAAEAGDRDALGYAAWLLERADRVDEAVALYLRAVEAGDRDALGHGADSWRTATALMKRRSMPARGQSGRPCGPGACGMATGGDWSRSGSESTS